MRHIKTKPQNCPKCGYSVDAITSIFEDHSPNEGDFSICISCYAILKFGKKWKLHLSSLEESEKYELRQTLEQAIATAKKVKEWQALEKLRNGKR